MHVSRHFLFFHFNTFSFSFSHNKLIIASSSHICTAIPQFKYSVAVLALATGASAFAPSVSNGRFSTGLNFQYGKYDDQLWDHTAKKDVYNAWDPNSPRSTTNFNPFETFQGNSPDASGIYPGENRYKDPQRGDVNYAQMMEEKADIEGMAMSPKAGAVAGCPGCKPGGSMPKAPEGAMPAPAAAAPVAAAPVAAAPAPYAAAPAAPAPVAAAPADGSFAYGKYDDQLWDHTAKKDVYNAWDPNSPRSTQNFNPFETFQGNSPDASGIYPGENRYKDPTRGDVNYAQMMEEKADIEGMAANPKPGQAPGCPGCKN